MKNTLFLLCLTLLCAQPASAQTLTPRPHDVLVGSVHSVRIETALVSNTSGHLIVGARAASELLSFDEHGHLTERRNLSPQNSLFKQIEGRAYTYDAQGRETERAFYAADRKLMGRAITTYDEQQRCARRTFTRIDGFSEGTTEYIFDDKGHVVRETEMEVDGRHRSSLARTYDDKGRLLEEIFYRRDGALARKYVYTYDERGKAKGWIIYDADGVQLIRFSQRRDEQGNLIEMSHYERGTLMNVSTYAYQFDSHGNWTEMKTEGVQMVAGRPSPPQRSVHYRIITYY